VGRRRAGGYVFVTYKGDHLPFHVHIHKDREEIGRWDVENQRPMDKFVMNERLRRGLRKLGYLVEGEGEDGQA